MSNKAFKPKTFYDLAAYVKDQLLHTIPQELRQAANRTCISRAYYSVFLAFREMILDLPIRDVNLRKRVERATDAHAIVAESVRRVDSDIGDYIVNLRKMRNKADYRTNIAITLDYVNYAFDITNEITDKTTAIVSRLKESDIVSAWNKIQKEREKMRSSFGVV